MAGLLAGHIAAVTGGGSGIGQGICQAYAREGARVIVLDANLAGANETVDLVKSAGGAASAMKLDVTDRAACNAAAAETAKGGNISILVNNAGINRRTHITGDPRLSPRTGTTSCPSISTASSTSRTPSSPSCARPRAGSSTSARSSRSCT